MQVRGRRHRIGRGRMGWVESEVETGVGLIDWHVGDDDCGCKSLVGVITKFRCLASRPTGVSSFPTHSVTWRDATYLAEMSRQAKKTGSHSQSLQWRQLPRNGCDSCFQWADCHYCDAAFLDTVIPITEILLPLTPKAPPACFRSRWHL